MHGLVVGRLRLPVFESRYTILQLGSGDVVRCLTAKDLNQGVTNRKLHFLGSADLYRRRGHLGLTNCTNMNHQRAVCSRAASQRHDSSAFRFEH